MREKSGISEHKSHGRPAVVFFLAWLLPPILFRSAMSLFPLTALNADSVPFRFLAGFLLGITQDLFIALQAVFLCVLVQKLWKGTVKVAAALNAILTAGVLSFLVFDLLLCFKTGLRMNLHFLEYARLARCFWSSFQEMDPWMLWLGLGSAMLLALAGYVYLALGESILIPSYKVFLALFASLLLASAATMLAPPGIAYYASNAVFTVEHTLLSQAVSGGEHGRRWRTREDGSPSLQEFSRAEILERIDPAHPLLKRTMGFKGDRLFDLALEPGERPHVVFLFMESFRAADVGVLGGTHGVSPCFDRLSGQGILFTRFHASSVQTWRGMLASLFGILPPFSHGPVLVGEKESSLVGIPDLFKRRGYRTAYFHNGDLAFDRQDRFFAGHGFQELHGLEEIRSAFPSASQTSWGVHDEYLMPYVVDWMRQQDLKGEPSFVTMVTMSNHHPWQTPPGFSAPEPKPGAEGEYGRFLRSFGYADRCLGLFWDLLKKNGLEKRTVIFILGDTAQPMGEHDRNFWLIKDLYQENLHIPLLILAEGRIPEPKAVDCIGSQVDLLPTVMDLFQMQGLNHAVGTSLMRRVEDRTVFFNNPFLLGYWGLRRNDQKMVYCTDTGKAMLYDLGSDPGENENLALSMPHVSSQCLSLLKSTHVLTEAFYGKLESLARCKALKKDEGGRRNSFALRN